MEGCFYKTGTGRNEVDMTTGPLTEFPVPQENNDHSLLVEKGNQEEATNEAASVSSTVGLASDEEDKDTGESSRNEGNHEGLQLTKESQEGESVERNLISQEIHPGPDPLQGQNEASSNAEPRFARSMTNIGPPMVKVHYSKAIIKYDCTKDYFVEFPDEEQTDDNSPLQSLESVNEHALAKDFTETLSLKRKRDANLGEDRVEPGEERHPKRLLLQYQVEESSSKTFKAEEAGQSMPPTPK